jgi:hypothetical protein
MAVPIVITSSSIVREAFDFHSPRMQTSSGTGGCVSHVQSPGRPQLPVVDVAVEEVLEVEEVLVVAVLLNGHTSM